MKWLDFLTKAFDKFSCSFHEFIMNSKARLKIHRMQLKQTQIIIILTIISLPQFFKESFVKLIFPSGGKWTGEIGMNRWNSVSKKAIKSFWAFEYKHQKINFIFRLCHFSCSFTKAGRINFYVKHFAVATVKRAQRFTVKKGKMFIIFSLKRCSSLQRLNSGGW